MIRASVLVGVALSLVACSGVKSYEFKLRGSPDLNPNDDDKPNGVQVKVLRLKGQASADAFDKADFDLLWEKPTTVPGVELQGPILSVYVPVPLAGGVIADAAMETGGLVTLEQVPPEVTHVGLLANFNRPQAGKDRHVIPRDAIGADVWIVASTIGAPAPAAAPKQD